MSAVTHVIIHASNPANVKSSLYLETAPYGVWLQKANKSHLLMGRKQKMYRRRKYTLALI